MIDREIEALNFVVAWQIAFLKINASLIDSLMKAATDYQIARIKARYQDMEAEHQRRRVENLKNCN